MSPDHVKYGDIVSYAEGTLPAVRIPAVEAYLARQPEAARTVALWQAARESVRGDDTIAPPAALVERVRALFRDRARAVTPALVDRIAEAIASLIYDSRTQPAFAGYRGATTAFQLTFEHGRVSIDLQAEPGEQASSWHVMGQVSGAERLTVEISIHRQGEADSFVRCRADEHGVFSCELPSGRFDFRIPVGDEVIVLADVDLS